MDSRGPNFTVAETHALLEDVKCHYASIVGSSIVGGMAMNTRKKDIWLEITQNVNAMGSGQEMTLELVKLSWKNLQARATPLLKRKIPKQATNPLRKVNTPTWFWTLLEVRALKLCMGFKVLSGMVSLRL